MMKKLIPTFLLLIFSILSGGAMAQALYTVSTFAGTDTVPNDTISTTGFRNGPDSLSMFNHPCGVAVNKNGIVYVADSYNNVIRKVTADSTFTLAGDTIQGFADASGTAARFNEPLGICVDKNGNVFVADTYNNRIREVSPAGNVTTFAGNGSPGYSGDGGPATAAEFYLPVGVAADTNGNIYVTDNGNYVIREISTNGIISTFAGAGVTGYLNGRKDTAEFSGLYGIAADDSGTVYVTEYVNDDVRKIRNGIVTTVAGNDTNIIFHDNDTVSYYPFGYRNGVNDTSLFYDPTGIAVDSAGNIYISDEYNNAIRKISRKTTSTLAGDTNLHFVVDTTIRKDIIGPGDTLRDTIIDSAAIVPSITGYVNGTAPASRFNSPVGLAMDRAGNFYVADNGNNVIRKITFGGFTGIPPLTPPVNPILNIYPNPCSSQLTIAQAPPGKAFLYDLTGRVLWSSSNFKAPYILNISGFSPGIYLFSAQSVLGTVTKKIIIEH